MLHPAILLKRSLIFIHRWLGVALSILFMLWFCSGIVMMYWSFPGITREDRLKRAPVLNPAQIKLTPEEAWASLHRETRPGGVRLASFDGRPVYRFSASAGGGRGRRGGRGGADQAMVFADDGSVPGKVDAALIEAGLRRHGQGSPWQRQRRRERAGGRLSGRLAASFCTLRPLFKYSFADGQQVYVSGRDAEVVQYTTSRIAVSGRISARFRTGCISRRCERINQGWFQFVVWTSGIGNNCGDFGNCYRYMDVLSLQKVLV